MERTVAEAVDIMHLALVDTVFPVDFEKPADHGRNLIDFVAVKRDNPDPEDIGEVGKARILARLAQKLARQAIFGLDTPFERIDIEVIRLDAIGENTLHHLQQLAVGGAFFAIFLKNQGFPRGKPVIVHFFHICNVI